MVALEDGGGGFGGKRVLRRHEEAVHAARVVDVVREGSDKQSRHNDDHN